MAIIEFTILGPPKAQKRHRTVTRGRGGRVLPFAKTYDPSKGDKESILAIAQQHAPFKPLTGPLRVDIWAYFPRPASHYGTGRNAGILKSNAPIWYDKERMDRDNIDKIILDALTGIFWKGDGQICAGEIIRQYSEKPRTVIRIGMLI